jgi:hypothetical protein
VVLPTLAFLGVTTFERALRNVLEDVESVRRINRVRQFYLDAVPGVRRYLVPPVADQPVEVARVAGVANRS